MFALARMIGVSAYLLSVFGFIYLIRHIKKSQLIIVLILFAATLCCIAFAYEPHVTSDLYRIRIYAHDFAQQTHRELLE